MHTEKFPHLTKQKIKRIMQIREGGNKMKKENVSEKDLEAYVGGEFVDGNDENAIPIYRNNTDETNFKKSDNTDETNSMNGDNTDIPFRGTL